jgi:hypothetical protein
MNATGKDATLVATHRDLWAWLDAPFDIPMVIPDGEQMALFE